MLAALWIVGLASVFVWQGESMDMLRIFRLTPPARPAPLRARARAFDLTDFGGVGDGVTLNTEAFKKAVSEIKLLAGKGGGQLNVPPGRWLTGPFNLTSNMTLFLAQGAEILGITVSIISSS